MYGVGIDGLVHLDNSFLKGIDALELELKNSGVLAPDADIKKLKQDAKTKFDSEVLSYFVPSHSTPLKRAISGLSISELAELAETLIFAGVA